MNNSKWIYKIIFLRVDAWDWIVQINYIFITRVNTNYRQSYSEYMSGKFILLKMTLLFSIIYLIKQNKIKKLKCKQQQKNHKYSLKKYFFQK